MLISFVSSVCGAVPFFMGSGTLLRGCACCGGILQVTAVFRIYIGVEFVLSALTFFYGVSYVFRRLPPLAESPPVFGVSHIFLFLHILRGLVGLY